MACWTTLSWLAGAQPATEWRPASGPLLTRWAADVNPANPHPEYPRPSLVRESWTNLNGLWDFTIVPENTSVPTQYTGRILVPFPVESALSGVMRRLDETETLWYRRAFTVPAGWKGRRVRLNFGAVDWRARVFINGRFIGQHRGGYDSFSFDITDRLTWSGREEVIVGVDDPTEADQPRGKQSREPEGIFYTPSSGIWQTVWLEPVSKQSIDDLVLVSDVDAGSVRVKAVVPHATAKSLVEVIAFSGGQEIARATAAPNREFDLVIPTPRLWSPDDPHLYDVRVTLRDADRELDSVSSYFGMRKVGLRKDAGGVIRIELNDRFVFQAGALDQGFWPDGLYAAPTDAALRYDIEVLRQCGFNLARKHVKVEPARWYYWCDKLGLLVWQDMPSGKNNSAEGQAQFEIELQRMIETRRHHPSIVLWVLFNEGWGQYDTERLAAWVKAFDPSRLVSNASGWTDKRAGDVFDVHSYPGPDAPPLEAGRASVVGEFGGIGLGRPGHTWSDTFWGYQQMPDQKALTETFTRLWDRAHLLKDFFGLTAAVYTQTTDVETECNGLMTYDRAVIKMDVEVMRDATTGKARRPPFEIIAPNMLYGRVLWKFTTSRPAAEWNQTDFNDAAWSEGLGGFGTKETPGTLVNTAWATSDIWLRREFRWDGGDPRKLRLLLHHDEDVEVYFNGVLAAKLSGFVTSYQEIEILPEALAVLQSGSNVLAVHCHQSRGGQYIDVGIVRVDENSSTR